MKKIDWIDWLKTIGWVVLAIALILLRGYHRYCIKEDLREKTRYEQVEQQRIQLERDMEMQQNYIQNSSVNKTERHAEEWEKVPRKNFR